MRFLIEPKLTSSSGNEKLNCLRWGKLFCSVGTNFSGGLNGGVGAMLALRRQCVHTARYFCLLITRVHVVHIHKILIMVPRPRNCSLCPLWEKIVRWSRYHSKMFAR